MQKHQPTVGFETWSPECNSVTSMEVLTTRLSWLAIESLSLTIGFIWTTNFILNWEQLNSLKNQEEMREKVTCEVKDYSRRKAQNGQAKKLHKKTQKFTIIASHSREIKQLPFNICGTRRACGCGEKGKMLYSLKVALRVLDPEVYWSGKCCILTPKGPLLAAFFLAQVTRFAVKSSCKTWRRHHK